MREGFALSVLQWLMQASRIGAIFIVGLFIVNLMWPLGNVHWIFIPEKFIALVISIGSWIALEVRTLYLINNKEIQSNQVKKNSEAKPGQEELSVSDQALLERFEALIDDGALYFLRHHDFGGTFRRRFLDPFFEFADTWKGGRFKFADPAIEARFSRVREVAREFANIAATKTHVVHGNNDMATVNLDPHGRQLNPDAERIELEAAKAVNEAAGSLVEAIDDFSSFAHGVRDNSRETGALD